MSAALHTGDVIKVRQGSMELYRIKRDPLHADRFWISYIGNAQAEGLPIETHNRINYVGHPSTNYPPLPTPPKAEE